MKCLPAFLCLVVVAVAAPARAQPDSLQKAQQLFDAAQQAIAIADYDAAAARFKEAYAAKPLPDFLYNTGTAYYLKGKKNQDVEAYKLAVKYYGDYLRDVPQASDKADIDKAIAIIGKEIERLAPPGGTAPPPTSAPSAELDSISSKTRSLVVIESEPQGANIYLDDKATGVFAQTPWSGSMDGQHKIIIEKRGHKTIESTIAPDPQRLVVLQTVLAEEDYLGWLEIRSNIPGADIYADDKAAGAIGKTPFSGNFKPGKHTFWIVADGYDEVEKPVEIIAGQVHEIDAQLAGSPVGYIDIRGTGLSGAHVSVDGDGLCDRAPCRKPIKEGVHTVVVTRGGYKPYKVRLDVQAKTEISIRPELAKKPSRTDAIVAYTFAVLFAGGATAAYVYQGRLTPADSNYDKQKYFKYGAYGGWGLGGLIGLSAVYYTFRDKGPPSTGQVDVRAVALEPTVGQGFAGLSLSGGF